MHVLLGGVSGGNMLEAIGLMPSREFEALR
jgi:hypothetical protein